MRTQSITNFDITMKIMNMVHLHEAQYTAHLALKRIVFRLLNRNELTSGKVDRLYHLGSERGFCKDLVGELIMDCQIEYAVN